MEFNQFFDQTDPLLWLVCFVILITLFVFLRLKLYKKLSETPRMILRQKFFKGQINSKEYAQQKRILQRDEDLKLKAFLVSRMKVRN